LVTDDRLGQGLKGSGAGRPWAAPISASVLVELSWGLGDVLLATSAIRRLRDLRDDLTIRFRTYAYNQTSHYGLEYPHGCPAEMLYHNPDIDEIIDWSRPIPPTDLRVALRYAWFGGPSLDYPIQAHYWENLGLEWEPGQRFDAVYTVTGEELAWGEHRLRAEQHGPYLALTPQTGWAGKAWSIEGWADLIAWCRRQGVTPIVMAGHRLMGAPWDSRGVLNLSGELDVRQSGAILQLVDHAVMTEGMLSNLRFALGRRAILLTCATLTGVQIWTPPELTTEVRMMGGRPEAYPLEPAKPAIVLAAARLACEPCMWRRGHENNRSPDIPPASIAHCPAGASLRDISAKTVTDILELE